MERNDDQWQGIENAIEDPEELRVIFCALDSFLSYAKTAHFNCTHLRRQAFYALPQAHWQMLAAPPFNYLETLDRVDAAIESNGELARSIVEAGLQYFHVGGSSPPSRAEDAGSSSSPTAAGHNGDDHGSSSALGRSERAGQQHVRNNSRAALQQQPPRQPTLPPQWAGCAKYSDIDKARSTVRQFYRDWSAEGAAEREACYAPIMRALEAERDAREARWAAEHPGGNGTGPAAAAAAAATAPNPAAAAAAAEGGPPRMKVLVPGAGLGRLVFELALHGYEAEGNEISYHQLLASSWVLNCCERSGQYTIYPWIHTFSNHLSRANHLRAYGVPDVHCASELARAEREFAEAQGEGGQQQQQHQQQQQAGLGMASGEPTRRRPRQIGSMSMCAADFLCLYGDEAHQEAFDAVATAFFLDTAPNLIRYLQTIFSCLKPGGLLINVGPLLWHFENVPPQGGGRGSSGDSERGGSSNGDMAHGNGNGHGHGHGHGQSHGLGLGHGFGFGGGEDESAGETTGVADPGSFELCENEVMALVQRLGFEVLSRETGVHAPYIQDTESMLQTTYRASSWVARKPERRRAA